MTLKNVLLYYGLICPCNDNETVAEKTMAKLRRSWYYVVTDQPFDGLYQDGKSKMI